MRWDLKLFLSDLWESFSAIGRNNPISSYGSSESSYFYSAAWSRKGVRCLSCAVFIRAAGITFLSFLGSSGPWGETSLFLHHLFPSFFSLCSPLPLPLPSPSLFPYSLSCVCCSNPSCCSSDCYSNKQWPCGEILRLSLSAEGRLAQHSKEAEVYLEEQTVNNHICKPCQDCWVLEKRWNPWDLSLSPRQSRLPWGQVQIWGLDLLVQILSIPLKSFWHCQTISPVWWRDGGLETWFLWDSPWWVGSEVPAASSEEKMPESQVSFHAAGARRIWWVPQAQRKLPLELVPSQAWGNCVELQIWMTGLLFVLVMWVSKDCMMPRWNQFTMRLPCAENPWRRWMGKRWQLTSKKGDFEQGWGQQQEKHWNMAMEHLKLIEKSTYGWGQVKVAQGRLWVEQGDYVPGCLCRCQMRMEILLSNHISQEETKGKAMLKSSEEAGRAFIFSKTWKQKLSDENWSILLTCILNV